MADRDTRQYAPCPLREPLRYAKQAFSLIGGTVIHLCPGCGKEVRGDEEQGGWVHA